VGAGCLRLAALTARVRTRSSRLAEEQADAAGRPAARGAACAGGHMTNSGSVLLSPREELGHVTLVRAAARQRGGARTDGSRCAGAPCVPLVAASSPSRQQAQTLLHEAPAHRGAGRGRG